MTGLYADRGASWGPTPRVFHGTGYYIACPDYMLGPIKDEASAERRLAGIVKMGECPHAHEIIHHDAKNPA